MTLDFGFIPNLLLISFGTDKDFPVTTSPIETPTKGGITPLRILELPRLTTGIKLKLGNSKFNGATDLILPNQTPLVSASHFARSG